MDSAICLFHNLFFFMKVLVFPGLVASHLLEGNVCYERSSHRVDIHAVTDVIAKIRHKLEQDVKKMVERKNQEGKQASVELHKAVVLGGLRLRRTDSGDDIPSDAEMVSVLRKRQLAISEIQADPEMLYSVADDYHLLAGRTSAKIKSLGKVADSIDQAQFTLDRLYMVQRPGKMSITCPARQSSRALTGQLTVPDSEQVINLSLELAHQVTRVGLARDWHVIEDAALVEMVRLEKSIIAAIMQILSNVENGDMNGFIKQPAIDEKIDAADKLIKVREEQVERMKTMKSKMESVIAEIAKLGLDLDISPSLSTTRGVISITAQRRGFQLFALLRSTQA